MDAADETVVYNGFTILETSLPVVPHDVWARHNFLFGNPDAIHEQFSSVMLHASIRSLHSGSKIEESTVAHVPMQSQ